MNFNQIANMFMRVIMRKAISSGINAGVNAVAGDRKKGRRRNQPEAPVHDPMLGQQSRVKTTPLDFVDGYGSAEGSRANRAEPPVKSARASRQAGIWEREDADDLEYSPAPKASVASDSGAATQAETQADREKRAQLRKKRQARRARRAAREARRSGEGNQSG